MKGDTVTEPSTAAGRRMLLQLTAEPVSGQPVDPWPLGAILAIEAEAAALDVERLAEAICASRPPEPAPDLFVDDRRVRAPGCRLMPAAPTDTALREAADRLCASAVESHNFSSSPPGCALCDAIDAYRALATEGEPQAAIQDSRNALREALQYGPADGESWAAFGVRMQQRALHLASATEQPPAAAGPAVSDQSVPPAP